MALVITDPRQEPRARSALDRFAVRLLNEERDIVFARLAFLQSVLVIPLAVAFFAAPHVSWLLAIPYWLLVLAVFLGPYILMLHNTSHRKLFKRQHEWLNAYIPLVLGPFFGESPGTYFAHHVGMHHPENNLRDDLSSTLDYQRDSFVDFMRYFARFFAIGLIELSVYFHKRGRYALMRKALIGELGYYAGAAALAAWNWRATVVVFLVPFLVARFMMMAGNWGQHAFIDLAAPENCYRNSVTCINVSYNRKCFNDGYHIGHHLKATRHWTEMPLEFEQNLARYAEEGALVFRGVDFFMIWALLMLKRYDWLARRVVALDETPRTEAELIAMMRARTRRSSAVIESLPRPAVA
jgi:hypothetical protein